MLLLDRKSQAGHELATSESDLSAAAFAKDCEVIFEHLLTIDASD
jgi:hypothetical protein